MVQIQRIDGNGNNFYPGKDVEKMKGGFGF